MLGNLAAEMSRRGLSATDLSRVTGKTVRSMQNKVAGRYEFTMQEAKTIRDAFFIGMDLEYLFTQTGT